VEPSSLRALELSGPHGPEPLADFGWVLVIHVEEVSHHRFDDRLTLIVRRHVHDPSKHFERTAIPVLDNIVMCGESGVYESPETLADFFSPLPHGDAKVSLSIFFEAVEALSEGLVIDLLPECQQPRRRRSLRKRDLIHIVLLLIANREVQQQCRARERNYETHLWATQDEIHLRVKDFGKGADPGRRTAFNPIAT